MQALTTLEHFPPGFFARIGRYVQLCAHIEGVAWRILVRQHSPATLELNPFLLSARKSHNRLKGCLRKAAAKMPDAIGSRLLAVMDRIDAEIDYRHIAVHGMWFATEDPDQFRVEYFKDTEDRGWVSYDAPISTEMIENVLTGAHQILIELLEIDRSLALASGPKPAAPR